MFHRVDDPLGLPSSRFFRMAQRLYLRGGAVTAALMDEPPVAEPSPSQGAAPADVDNSDQIAAMSAMSQNPGFPGIGYSGG